MAKRLQSKSVDAEPRGPVVPIDRYKSCRELAAAVFRECDVAIIAGQLLSGDESKGGAVRARILEKLIEMYYGKPTATAPAPRTDEVEVRVDWTILPLPNGETH